MRYSASNFSKEQFSEFWNWEDDASQSEDDISDSDGINMSLNITSNVCILECLAILASPHHDILLTCLLQRLLKLQRVWHIQVNR